MNWGQKKRPRRKKMHGMAWIGMVVFRMFFKENTKKNQKGRTKHIDFIFRFIGFPLSHLPSLPFSLLFPPAFPFPSSSLPSTLFPPFSSFPFPVCFMIFFPSSSFFSLFSPSLSFHSFFPVPFFLHLLPSLAFLPSPSSPNPPSSYFFPSCFFP